MASQLQLLLLAFEQWGFAEFENTKYTDTFFPIAFNSAVYQILINDCVWAESATSMYETLSLSWAIRNTTTSKFRTVCSSSNAGSTTYIAIGR